MSKRKPVLLTAAAILVVGGIFGTALAMTGGGSPTHLAVNVSSPRPSPTPPGPTPTASAKESAPAAPSPSPLAASPTPDAQQRIIDAAYAITHQQAYP